MASVEVERIDYCVQHIGNVPSSMMATYTTPDGSKRKVCEKCKEALIARRSQHRRKLAGKPTKEKQ
jgi:hypothetical protein